MYVYILLIIGERAINRGKPN